MLLDLDDPVGLRGDADLYFGSCVCSQHTCEGVVGFILFLSTGLRYGLTFAGLFSTIKGH